MWIRYVFDRMTEIFIEKIKSFSILNKQAFIKNRIIATRLLIVFSHHQSAFYPDHLQL